MKNIFLLFYLILLINCGDDNDRKCPYTEKYGAGHYFKIPMTVSPHQLRYKVGDTITLSAIFSNRLEDINYEQIFEVDSALIRPAISLLRFENGEYKGKISGPENFIVEAKYLLGFGQSVHTYITYADKNYSWQVKIILRKAGHYVFTIEDPSSSNEDELIRTRETFNFPEKCYNGFLICNMIQGDAHMKELETELIYIDKKITFDNMRSLNDRKGQGVYGGGYYNWETSGTYGFIVE